MNKSRWIDLLIIFLIIENIFVHIVPINQREIGLNNVDTSNTYLAGPLTRKSKVEIELDTEGMNLEEFQLVFSIVGTRGKIVYIITDAESGEELKQGEILIKNITGNAFRGISLRELGNSGRKIKIELHGEGIPSDREIKIYMNRYKFNEIQTQVNGQTKFGSPLFRIIEVKKEKKYGLESALLLIMCLMIKLLQVKNKGIGKNGKKANGC